MTRRHLRDRHTPRSHHRGRHPHLRRPLRQPHTPPTHQRREQPRHRQVERHRRPDQRHPRHVRIRPRRITHIRSHTRPRHHHPLRPPRRPRRIDHIRRPRPRHPHHKISGVPPGTLLHRARVIHHQHRQTRRQRPRQRTRGHRDRRRRVGQHIADPLRRILRIHRHIRAAGLPHRQQRHHQLHRPRQHHPHEAVRAHAAFHQHPGQPVRPRVQLRIRDLRVPAHHRHRVRRLPRLPHETIDQEPVHHRHRPGVVPPLRDPLPFVRAQQVDPADRAVRCAGDRGEDPLQGVRVPVSVLGVDHVRLVLDAQRQLRARDREQVDRVVRRALRLHTGDSYVVEEAFEALGVERVVLEHGDRVEEFTVSRPALDVRQARVVVVGELGLFPLEPGDEVLERFGGVDAHAYRQGVDEQPDHRLHARQLGGTPGHRRAEHHVGATGRPRQHEPPRGLHHRVQGDAPLPRAPAELPGGVRVQRDGDRLGDDGGVASSRRPDQCRALHPGEGVPPDAPGLVPVTVGEPPQVVLEGTHLRKAPVVAALPVQPQQLTEEHGGRPAVPQDVVVGHQET